jgi:hypothetical protein
MLGTTPAALAQDPRGQLLPFGVHRDGPFPHDSLELESILQNVAASGARWLRINVPWDWLEREPGSLEWWRLDLVVDRADDLGIELLATVRGYSEMSGYPDPPARLRAYQSLLRGLVRRYGDRIRHWQIENEVTSQEGWQSSLADYVVVLETAHATIKRQDPSARVLLSSMGSNFLERILYESESARGREALSQLQFLLREGRGSYDIVDAHVYHRVADVGRRVALFRDLLAAMGDDLPVWITEMGGPDRRVARDADPQTTAADEVVKRYVLALEAGAEKMFWHQIAVRQGRNTTWSDMALMEGDHRRPAFQSYRTMVDMLDGLFAVERLPAAAGVSLFRLRLASGELYVVWSDSPRALGSPFGDTMLTVTDVTGASTTTTALASGQSPLYVQQIR